MYNLKMQIRYRKSHGCHV